MKITAQWVKEKVTEKAEHWTALLNDIEMKLKDAVETQHLIRNDTDATWKFTYGYRVDRRWYSCINIIVDQLKSKGFSVNIDNDLSMGITLFISVTGEWK